MKHRVNNQHHRDVFFDFHNSSVMLGLSADVRRAKVHLGDSLSHQR